MDENSKAALTGEPGITAPVSAGKPPFAATKTEKILAFCMFPAAYLYVEMFNAGSTRSLYILLALFALVFCAMAALLCRPAGTPKESWVWLGCIAVILVSLLAGRSRVWGEALPVFFVHVFAVYWVLSRSGRLVSGESGHLLPLDALDGFVVFPFRHFFLRIKTLGAALLGRGSGARKSPGAILLIVAALLAAFGLLAAAAQLLSSADDNFGALVGGALDALRSAVNFNVLINLLVSLPVGAYLFGLLAGTAREDTAALRERGERTNAALAALRRIPGGVWVAVLAVFAAMYLAFFWIQGGYLFGAFSRTLPAGFTVAQYARQGFFELCKVMALNLALLWLVTRSASVPPRKNRPLLIFSTVLLAESVLLAVVALSKLALYISCFGFTPLRLQSSWLVCVLLFACVCALYSLWTGKKSMRAWMIFGAVTLSLLHLY